MTGGVVKVTVAVPLLLVSTVEAALTVRLAAVSLAATVKSPEAFIFVPLPPPETVHVTVWTGLLAPLTVALNCRVCPFITLAVEGLTVTPVYVGEGLATVTVTVQVAVKVPFVLSFAAAVMVVVPALTAVTTPFVTVATAVFLLLQVTVLFAALAGVTVAVRVSLPPTVRLVDVLFNDTPVTATGVPTGES